LRASAQFGFERAIKRIKTLTKRYRARIKEMNVEARRTTSPRGIGASCMICWKEIIKILRITIIPKTVVAKTFICISVLNSPIRKPLSLLQHSSNFGMGNQPPFV
jgi:hypothetical protein